ncbi:MAG: HAD-IIIA family hydrolase [Chitinophagaceae bacterium]|nr:HAD-IIIA family hydrolase [Chitinophagaceae bacterium]
MNLKSLDKSWTLFLDRDGVINDEKHMDYINTWDEFTFYPGVLDAIRIFSKKFGRIFIITNQRGVAKGVTKLEDLEMIHKNLLEQVKMSDGNVDRIYFSADMDDSHINRKPNTGMGMQAKKDFPEIDFTKSIMIGNTLSDMQFGKNLGVSLTVFLPTTRPDVKIPNALIDLVFPDLISVAMAL